MIFSLAVCGLISLGSFAQSKAKSAPEKATNATREEAAPPVQKSSPEVQMAPTHSSEQSEKLQEIQASPAPTGSNELKTPKTPETKAKTNSPAKPKGAAEKVEPAPTAESKK